MRQATAHVAAKAAAHAARSLADLRMLDALLEAHAASLGPDLAAYRNHASRVVHLCAALEPLDDDELARR